MLNISKIDIYRDGGTISIKCVMVISWKEVPYLEIHRNREIQICIDRRFRKEPLLWFGYPGKEDSELIKDQDIIDYIIKKVDEYKTRQNYKFDSFINYKENIRDWKIKNILE